MLNILGWARCLGNLSDIDFVGIVGRVVGVDFVVLSRVWFKSHQFEVSGHSWASQPSPEQNLEAIGGLRPEIGGASTFAVCYA